MPEPRRDRSMQVTIRVTMEPQTRDAATVKRRERAGYRSRDHRGGMPVEIRNGLPFRPYVYRGLGYDQLGGDDGQD